LVAHAATNVTVSINSNANGLPVAGYSDTVIFTNLTAATGSSRSVSLIVGTPAPATLNVSPVTASIPSVPKEGHSFHPAKSTR